MNLQLVKVFVGAQADKNILENSLESFRVFRTVAEQKQGPWVKS